MISFLQPLALLGLAAAVVPPLLHLLGRRLPPLVVFPAVRYLSETERRHSRRLKLRNLLLLLLRTAIIALIALAAARPVARMGFGGGHGATAVTLVVDNSLSSGAVLEGRPVLDLVIEQAVHVLDRAGDDDRFWIMLADGLPRRVSVPEARRLLDTLVAWPVRLDITEAVRTAARTMSDGSLVPREIVVLSDLQRTALTPGPVSEIPVLLWRPRAAPPNRGIDSAWVVPPVWSPAGQVIAVIGGSGGPPDEATAVRLTVGQRDLARSIGRVGDRLALSAAPPQSGWLLGSVALDPDELRADDVGYVAIRVSQPAAVTLLAGAGPFLGEAVHVLESAGRVRRGGDVTVGDRPGEGTTIVFPPGDPALLGAVNRSLASRGVGWRFGDVIEGEWSLSGAVGVAEGTPVYRRYELEGSGPVLATVDGHRAGGSPWLVRDGDVVLVASRMDEAWTALPVSAAFVPFVDLMINRVAAGESGVVTAQPGGVVELPATAVSLLTANGPLPVPSDRRITAPIEPGVYFLAAGGDTVGALVVNHDPQESQLDQVDGDVVRATLGDGARLLSTTALDRELFRGARRADLTGALLGLVLVMALVELGLATSSGAARREG